MRIRDTEFGKNALQSSLVPGWEVGTPSHLYVLAIPNYPWVTGTWRLTSVLHHSTETNTLLSIGLSSSNPFNALVVRWRKNWGFGLNTQESCLKLRPLLGWPASIPSQISCADSVCWTRLGLHEPLSDPHTILTLCVCVCVCLYVCMYIYSKYCYRLSLHKVWAMPLYKVCVKILYRLLLFI